MVGKAIRKHRRKKSLTLEKLANQVGVTTGGLSQIEREIVDPSLATLKKIAQALGISLYLLFSEEHGNYISRAKDRTKAYFHDLQIDYEFLTPRPKVDGVSPKISVVLITIKPHSWGSENLGSHEADECFVVLKGCLEIHMISEEVVTLYENDSIYHTEGVLHRIYNSTDSEAIAISILSDVIY